MKPKSIRRDLLKWQIGALLVIALLVSLITFVLTWNAFNHLRDDGLAQIAYSIVRHGLVSSDNEDDDDAADKGQFVSQIWDSDGELQYSSVDDSGPPRQQPGHHTVDWHGDRWHTYTLEDGGLTIQVGNPSTYHYADFRHIAPWLLLPLTLMVGVLGGLIWFAVGHALNPLQRVREEILRQELPKLHALAINDLPEEVVPLGEALNDLLQRLENAFASERNFIADAAHELRTPLTAVRLQAQLAQRADATDQRAAALTQLLAGVDRASHLVEQLLQMARLEPDAAQFSFATLRLDRLAKDVIGEFAPGADAKEIDLGMAKSRAVEVYGHAESLRVLLSNLVDNALRYTPGGGRVDVEIDTAAGQAVVSVCDSGPGIPAELRARVFDRFFRCAQSSPPGSGLGLAIVKQVARLHSGEVTLDTSADGGLVVRFVMPAVAAD